MVRHAKHILLALMRRTVRLSAIAEFFCARYMFADFSDCNGEDTVRIRQQRPKISKK